MASTVKGVCGITLGDERNFLLADLQNRFQNAELVAAADDDDRLTSIVAQVVRYINKPQLGLDLGLDIRGTDFQQRVWQALGEVPLGKTASYTDIARKIGTPHASCGRRSRWSL